MPMSPFVANLRSMVGHQLLQLPSVTALCRDESGRILVVREAASGDWSTPGGAIELGESLEEAAIREVEEETGLAIEIDRLRAVLGGPDYRTVYPKGGSSLVRCHRVRRTRRVWGPDSRQRRDN